MRLSCWKTIVSFLSLALFCAACTPEENKTEKTGHGEKDNSVRVTGISLNKTSATIIEGESIELEATVTPDNAENKRVLWSSDNNAVAAVNESGIVNAISEGKATIAAKTEDAGKMATCVVTVKRNTALSITIGTDMLSAISVVLKGKANLPASVAADLKVGFQYSKSAGILPTNSTTVDAEDADADYNYTTGVTGLDPETTYYFRSFVRQNGLDTYGETKSFTTNDLIETKDASDIEATKALLNAKLDLTNVEFSRLSYGFYWGTSEKSQNTFLSGGDIADNAFSAAMTNLSHKTQYWYKAYVKLDDQTFYGEVKTFTTDAVPVASVSLDKTEYTFNTIEGSITLYATVLPADATDKSVEWSSDNTDVATVDQNGRVTAKAKGTATITVRTNDQGKTATCVITVEPYTAVAPDAVDLGIVVKGKSIKWGSFNLGATKPEGYGDYFAWGETAPKDNYNWSSYKWCNGTEYSLIKYNFSSSYGTVDNKTVLDPEDDAAHVVLGGKWRMPTDAEWTALRNNCTWTWTSNYNGTGVAGRIVTSNVEGYTDKSIFLPAAGGRGVSIYGFEYIRFFYWSSSLNDPYGAYDVDFDFDVVSRGSSSRYYGQSVRPVSE